MNAPSLEAAEATTASDTNTVSFREALAFWFKLGCVSFGGPAGQIALMHTELVDRKRWISERRFLHALNYCMVLPGPEAQQLATYIGWLLHGTWGGIVAGTMFVLPSLVLLMAISGLYVAYGHLPLIAAVLNGIKPAVVAIVIAAVVRIGSRAIKNGTLLCFALASFLALACIQMPFPLIVIVAGFLGWLGARISPNTFKVGGHAKTNSKASSTHIASIIDDHHAPPEHASLNVWRIGTTLITGLVLWLVPIAVLVAWQGWHGTHARMGWFFTTAALVTFGGAYAVLPYVFHQAVNVFGWLESGQMIDGLALGETTPGPLIIVVSFVGFVGAFQADGSNWGSAIIGCLVATYFTFLPSFLFILVGAPFIERTRDELHLTAPLTGITAAVVGAIVNLALFFSLAVFLPGWSMDENWFSMRWLARFDYLAFAITILSLIALLRMKWNVAYVVAVAALLGVIRLLVLKQ